jgi:hypothetical protein
MRLRGQKQQREVVEFERHASDVHFASHNVSAALWLSEQPSLLL